MNVLNPLTTCDAATATPVAVPDTVVVETRDLRKAYRRGGSVVHVLDGVDLQVHRGQCVMLVGPSGSGKSTLLSILGCILTPDSGQIRIMGRDLTRIDDQTRIAVRRDVIGFVFQRFQLIRGLTVLENVLVPLQLQNRPPLEARRRANELIEAVGLSDHARAKPQQLSAGQCQRVAFARALVSDPQLILADEPTASLDATTGDEIMRLLRDLVARFGKTAIVVTHDPRIFSYAHRVCRLDQGRIQEAGG